MNGKLRLEYRAVSSLIPYARNARTHSQDQVAQIVASIREFGWTNPVLIDEAGGIIAGHGRVMAAGVLGLDSVPTIELAGLSEAQRRAYVIADNKLALNAGWDEALLAEELTWLEGEGFGLDLVGFSDAELEALLREDDEPPQDGGSAESDKVPDVAAREVSRRGEVWVLGGHRVMCGDSTAPADVAALMAGQRAGLMHADPPYGMGKASDGVANDNLYREELDRFQMAWWRAFRPHLEDNASAYVWGNASELWRLWYRGGLADSEELELRNEIVWDKKAIPGMASAGLTSYPTASERCLFFQIGNQFLGNINVEDFPEAWEPLRAYLADEAAEAGIKQADVLRVCGCRMFGHWFTRSQFNLVPEKHYAALRAAYPGRFARPWSSLKAEWDRVKGGPQSKIQGARSFFDNTHDAMRDVWEFSRVVGEERHGHATPKPVAMMERVMRSSSSDGGLCVEPFGGSGSTLMGAEATGRRCFTMELQPVYVDVIVRRWQQATGQAATLEGVGDTFDDIAEQRLTETA